MAITTINENDYIKDSRAVINSNFTELDEGKLSLSGGTMTGSIILDGNYATLAKQATDDLGITICGGTDTASPYITLYGKDHDTSPSAISIRTGSSNPALQLSSDGSLTWNSKEILTVEGGTISGGFTRSGGTKLCSRDVNNSFLYIGGSTSDANGAYLTLYGKDHSNEGRFILAAKDGTNSTLLQGQANGTLTWAGKDIERVNASGSDYIRFENGLQICWGYAQTTTSGHTYTFPVSFDTSPRIAFTVGNTTEANTSYSTKVTNLTKTSFKGICSTTSNSGANISCTYIAVGYWK